MYADASQMAAASCPTSASTLRSDADVCTLMHACRGNLTHDQKVDLVRNFLANAKGGGEGYAWL
jgi:hypothetical protein